jgi:hypothetical protein
LTRYCTNCGAAAPDVARFCGSCGGALDPEPTKSADPSAAVTQPAAAPPVGGPRVPATLLVFGAFMLVGALAAGGFVFVRGSGGLTAAVSPSPTPRATPRPTPTSKLRGPIIELPTLGPLPTIELPTLAPLEPEGSVTVDLTMTGARKGTMKGTTDDLLGFMCSFGTTRDGTRYVSGVSVKSEDFGSKSTWDLFIDDPDGPGKFDPTWVVTVAKGFDTYHYTGITVPGLVESPGTIRYSNNYTRLRLDLRATEEPTSSDRVRVRGSVRCDY